MKAVFFLQADPFRPKPALRALREADSLARAGWGVSFVCWIKAASVSPSPVPDRYPIHRIPARPPAIGTSFLGRARVYRRVLRHLAKKGIEEKPDLIVGHDLEVLPAAVETKRATGKPLIYDSHEDWPALIAENSRLESLVSRVLEIRQCRHVDLVVTVSAPIADKFRRMGKRTEVLYNARPSTEIQRSDREASRRAFGYDPEDFVVGFAGALARGRGLEVLLDALRELPDAFKVLLVGGPAEMAAELRREARSLGVADRVRVDDFLPFPELAPYYAAMDVGAILADPWPNHLRALPNKLFDCIANGVPVIVPNYPAMAPIVREGPSGWIVDRVATSSVVATLKEARASGQAAERGKVGREIYLRKYAWERQAEEFMRWVAALTTSA